MSTTFNPRHGLVIVTARLYGPAGVRAVRVALDTGASATVINAQILSLIGYDPAASPQKVQITTGSGAEVATRLVVDRIECLGQDRLAFPVVAHTLPPAAAIDGLVGLDFFRNHQLLIDFRNGVISLS